MSLRRIAAFLVVITLGFGLITPPSFPDQVKAQAPVECRFGVTVASWTTVYPDLPNTNVSAYDLPLLGIGYYLDWDRVRSPSVPGFITYLNVLPVKDGVYSVILSQFVSLITSNPGAVWVLGNEPDDGTGEQDYVTPEVYADRSFVYATLIRQLDPTAKIGFGTIVMGTELRVRYLQRAWDRLIVLTGNPVAASALIDYWMPHGFVLNETLTGGWGSRIPLGMESEAYLAENVPLGPEILSMTRFSARIERYRSFMNAIGEENKPLWLTEFGHLLPSVTPDPKGVYYPTLPEADTIAFMNSAMNYLFTKTSTTTGLPSDSNRLVQKFFWYSLNDALYHFGGTLVNPETLTWTGLGSAFYAYEPPAGAAEPFLTPDFEPIFAQMRPIFPGNGSFQVTDYYVDVRVRNHITHNHLNPVQIELFDDQNNLLGSATGSTARCGGDWVKSFRLNGITPGLKNIRVVVSPVTGSDTNPGNNTKTFPLQFVYYNNFISLVKLP